MKVWPLLLAALVVTVLATACGDGGQPTVAPAPTVTTVATGKIAFVRDGPFGAIYVMNADGSKQTLLTAKGDGYPTWSPDGARIAFARRSTIYVMNADGTGQTRLTDNRDNRGIDTNPAWSPVP